MKDLLKRARASVDFHLMDYLRKYTPTERKQSQMVRDLRELLDEIDAELGAPAPAEAVVDIEDVLG